MIELAHRRSAGKTFGNKVGYLCYLKLNYCIFASYSELHFTVLIHFEERDAASSDRDKLQLYNINSDLG